MFNLILGIILCILVMKYNQEIVQFLIASGKYRFNYRLLETETTMTELL